MTFLVLRSIFDDAGLIRHADPEVAVRIELEIERAVRLLGLQQSAARSPSTLPVLGSSSPTSGAEVRIPDVAVGDRSPRHAASLLCAAGRIR